MQHRFIEVAGFLLLLLAACGPGPSGEKQIIIFHAGSVSRPIREVSDAFMKLHPEIKIWHEAAGSVESARKITDLKRACDVFVSADVSLIEKLLWPRYASQWYGFAGNAIGIAYTPESKYSSKINTSNWHEVLLRTDVNFARSDPQVDPCGYRTLFVWQLAEKLYKKPGLYKALLLKDQRLVRPKETDLLVLLQTHNADYIFIYRSIAIQHGLHFIELPDSVNLSQPRLDEFYQNATLRLRGLAPGDSIKQHGQAILYGVSIPLNAPHPQLAQEYLRFLLDKSKGLDIFKAAGHTMPDSVLVYPER